MQATSLNLFIFVGAFFLFSSAAVGADPAQSVIDLLNVVSTESKQEAEKPVSYSEPQTLHVAVMDSDGLLNRKEIVRDFVSIVSSSVPSNTAVVVETLSPAALAEAVRQGRIDVFFANSVFYRSMLPYGVKDIATVHSEWTPNPNSADGAAIFVSRSRSDINSIKDLKGSSVAVSDISSPDAWYFALGAVKNVGADPDKFFGRVVQTRARSISVVKKVLSGQTDAGVIPACFLELYVLERPQIFEEVKVLDYLKSSELPCTVSTPLYPNWTVAVTPSCSMTAARIITKNLLSIPENPPRSWWAVSTKFDQVDRLLRDLKVEQYAILRQWSVQRVLREYGLFVGVFIALFIGLAFYGFFANRLIRRRTRQLAVSLARQAQVQRKFESARKNLSALTRMGLLTPEFP